MNIIVTGATGFVGRHLVLRLLKDGHSVTAVARTEERAATMPWLRDVKFVAADIGSLGGCVRQALGDADAIVHLAWPGLPHYRALFHLERNFSQSWRFLKSAVIEGYSRIVVTGTCLEYGQQSGCLREDLATNPDNSYAIAKDALRKYLEQLWRQQTFGLVWCRLFYVFGEGQNSNSLVPLLDSAIARHDNLFPMSGGEQTRDFLPIAEAARRISVLAARRDAIGTFNICSGVPVTVRRFVESRIQAADSKLRLQLGVYQYPDYEPFEFWGDSSKYLSLEGQSSA